MPAENNLQAVPGHDHYWELWLNPEGQVSYRSPSLDSFAGQNLEEFLKDPKVISKIVYPDDLHLFEAHLVESCELHLPGKMEIRMIRPDGEVRWIRHACIPVFDENGQYAGTRGSNWDITEHRNAEEIIKTQRDLGMALDKATSLQESLQLCLSAALKISGLEAGGIYMLDQSTGDLNLIFISGHTDEFAKINSKLPSESKRTQAVMAGKPFYLNSQDIQSLDFLEEKLHAIAVIPFIDKGLVIGNLIVSSRIHNEISAHSRNALESIARQISAAILRAQAEQNLRLGKEKYRSIFENAVEGIFQTTPKGRILTANPVMAKLFGYESPDDFICNVRDVGTLYLNPADRLRFRQAVEKMGTVHQFEFTARRHDGKEMFISMNARAIKDKEGNISHYDGIFEDITDRKLAQEALQESENWYRTIFETTGAATTILDENTIIILANAEFEKLSGYTKNELEGKKSWTDFIVREDLAMMIARNKQRIIDRDSVPKNYEFRFQDRHGNISNIFLTSDIIPGTKRAVASLTDITERRKIENDLRRSEERLRSIVETSNAGIIMTTTDGEILYANPQIAGMLGYGPQTLMDKNYYDFVCPDEKTSVDNNVRLVVEGGAEHLSFERRYLRRDGSELCCYVSCGHSQVFTGKKHMVLIISDISQLKQVEKEKKQLEDHLRQAQKMEAIGTLAGGIAHDFNNILASMMGYTEIAVKETRPDIRQNYLEQVLRACERAKNLVNQILAFSRRREQERRPLEIRLILKEALNLLRATLPTTIEMRQDITPEETTVLADPTQIHQIIMNLCTNAAHSMKGKGGLLDVHLSNIVIDTAGPLLLPDLPPGAYVQLSVRDTGHGIDAAIQDKIFDPFFTTKKTTEGTGLGLSVVYGIVKSYGGGIKVQSAAGEGATFTIYLPHIHSTNKVKEKASEDINLRGHERLLFVDDEEALVSVVKIFFQSLGYSIAATTSSVEALRLFQENPEAFDLVITDMTMPEMTGAELARAFLKIRPEMPIILCTGYNDSFSVADARKMNIREFCLKPISLKDLGLLVRRVLKG